MSNHPESDTASTRWPRVGIVAGKVFLARSLYYRNMSRLHGSKSDPGACQYAMGQALAEHLRSPKPLIVDVHNLADFENRLKLEFTSS